jgi:hypothetical protein
MAGSERAETPIPTTGTAASAAADRGTPTASSGDRRWTGASGPPSTEGSTAITEREAFQITLLRNSHYHEDRERFFAWWHKVTMFVVVLGAIATFAPIDKYWIAALVIAFAGLVDLVFDVSGRARLHASLRRRIYDLLAEAQDNDVDLTKMRKRAIDVYADEPPCMHAVNALAYNSAMASFERPQKLQLRIRWWQRIFRNVWPFPETDFKTFEELDRMATTG